MSAALPFSAKGAREVNVSAQGCAQFTRWLCAGAGAERPARLTELSSGNQGGETASTAATSAPALIL